MRDFRRVACGAKHRQDRVRTHRGEKRFQVVSKHHRTARVNLGKRLDRAAFTKPVGGIVWRNAVEDELQNPALNRFQNRFRNFQQPRSPGRSGQPVVVIMSECRVLFSMISPRTIRQPFQLMCVDPQTIDQFGRVANRRQIPKCRTWVRGHHGMGIKLADDAKVVYFGQRFNELAVGFCKVNQAIRVRRNRVSRDHPANERADEPKRLSGG